MVQTTRYATENLLIEGEVASFSYQAWTNEPIKAVIKCSECDGESEEIYQKVEALETTFAFEGKCKKCQKKLLAKARLFVI